jgi:hypothetical protein
MDNSGLGGRRILHAMTNADGRVNLKNVVSGHMDYGLAVAVNDERKGAHGRPVIL